MIALKIPFQIDATGRVATIVSRDEEIRQHVITVVHTRVRERVMRPTFGTRALDFLFDPADELLLAGFQEDIKDSLTRLVPEVEITYIKASLRETLLEVEFGYRSRDLMAASTVDTVEIDVGGTVSAITDQT